MLPAAWQMPVFDFFTAGALASCVAAAALGAVCAACTGAAVKFSASMAANNVLSISIGGATFSVCYVTFPFFCKVCCKVTSH